MNVKETIQSEIAATKERLGIYKGFAAALPAHVGKPIGKRLADAVRAAIAANNNGREPIVQVDAPKESFRKITVWYHFDRRESIHFGYEAKSVPSEAADEAKKTINFIEKRLEELGGQLNNSDSLESEYREAAKAFVAAKNKLESFQDRLSYLVREAINKEVGV